MSIEKKKKEIEVITGDGKDLNISPVYEHEKTDSTHNTTKKKNVIIPQSSKNKKNK